MADKVPAKPKKLVIKKKRETIREKVDKSTSRKSPRIRKFATATRRPVGKVGSILAKEYHPLKTGNSKAGKALSRRSRLTPRYFADSFAELRKVTWPSRKTALKLMFAVFVFSFGLSALVRAIDYGFDKLFQEVILK